MEISLPNNIRSNIDGYQALINIFNKCKVLNNTTVYFNCIYLTFFEANLCALLGCIIEKLHSNNCRVEFIEVKDNVKTIMLKNGFLKYYFNNEQIVEDTFGTTVKYLAVHKNDDDDIFEKYIIQEVLGKDNFPSMSVKLTEKILTNIFEVYVNAKTHGKCEFIHACGQFFPRNDNKPLRFTIVDLGVNIKENVSLFMNIDVKACEAIKWAMKKGNTTKTTEPGGLGLSYIFEFIELNMGKVEIISSNGIYIYEKGEVLTIELNEEFSGTIVNFTFNLDDKKKYKLTQE